VLGGSLIIDLCLERLEKGQYVEGNCLVYDGDVDRDIVASTGCSDSRIHACNVRLDHHML
jgi:hypothetical protein